MGRGAERSEKLSRLEAEIAAFVIGSDTDRLLAGRLHLKLANALNRLERRRHAERAARRAIELLEPGAADQAGLLADAYGELGEALWSLDDGGAAAAYEAFSRTRSIVENLPSASPEDVARALENEALCLHSLERPEEALALQDRAVRIADEHKLATRARWARRRMSNTLQDQGHFTSAAERLEEARPPSRASVEERIGWLHSHARLAERRGDYFTAEQWYDRAAALFERKGSVSPRQVACLVNAAMLKTELDAFAQARRLLGAAQALAPTQAPTSYAVKRHVADALMEARQGNVDTASRLMNQAVAEARVRNAGNRKYEQEIVASHAELLRAAGRGEPAMALLKSALSASTVSSGGDAVAKDDLPVALPLIELQLERGIEIAFARKLLQPFLGKEIATGDADTEWRVLSCVADLAARDGLDKAAVFFGKLAVMKTLASLEPFPPESYEREAIMTRRERPFHNLLSRLIRLGRMHEANRVRALLTRERAFNLASRSRHAAKPEKSDLLGDDELARLQRYEERRAAVRDAADFLADQRMDAARRRQAEGKLERARAALLSFFERAGWGAPTGARRVAEARSPADVPAPGVAILRYYVQADETVAEVTTPSGETRYPLPLPRHALADAVFGFLERIRAGRSCIVDAQDLHRKLIDPFERQLDGIERIEILADGPLASLPFAALHDGHGYLVQRFDIAYRSGISSANREVHPGDIALFGVSKPWAGLPALEHVPRELEAIASNFPRAVRRLDRRFTEASLKRALVDGADAVHVASHYHLVPGSPSRSFLLLGDGSRLAVSTFLSEAFNWETSGLVFLSACETAGDGDRFSQGETLAAALHLRGVRALIATLWPVADASTANLVASFYEAVANRRGLAGGLRQAQLSLLREDGGRHAAAPLRGSRAPRTVAGPRPFDHPVHWAAFKLFVPGQ